MNSGPSQMIAPQPQFARRHTLAALLRRQADRRHQEDDSIAVLIQKDDFFVRVAQPAPSTGVSGADGPRDPDRDGEGD